MSGMIAHPARAAPELDAIVTPITNPYGARPAIQGTATRAPASAAPRVVWRVVPVVVIVSASLPSVWCDAGGAPSRGRRCGRIGDEWRRRQFLRLDVAQPVELLLEPEELGHVGPRSHGVGDVEYGPQGRIASGRIRVQRRP